MHVRVRRGTGGLSRDSVLKCEQITTLPRSLLSASALGGPLSDTLLEDVERGVLRAMGVPIP
jgi:mRNA-degrading endonuclease toxin of MazEF toxin-antitoxin module